MQRKIKFKGKDKETGEWIYGTLIIIPAPPVCFGKALKDEYWIVHKDERYMPDWNMPYKMVRTEVEAETVGQYTGLKDRNMKEIYEGDIIFDSFYERKAKAVFLEGAFWLDYIDNFKEYETIHKRYQLLANYDNKSVLEVIGNIYDNPDLLEEGE